MDNYASGRFAWHTIGRQGNVRQISRQDGIRNDIASTRWLYSELYAHTNLENYSDRLRVAMSRLRLSPPRATNQKHTFQYKELNICSHVFLRRIAIASPLTAPYNGPYKVVARSGRVFKVIIKGKVETVTADLTIVGDLTSRSSRRVRAGRNRWSTGQHFRPAHTMCGTAALAHSSTGLLGSKMCNRVTSIQPHGWIAAPCRTGLSSTLISDNVRKNMEWIKNESRKPSTLNEFLQRTTACWPSP